MTEQAAESTKTTAYVLVYDRNPDDPWVEPQADMDEGVFLDRDKAQARADEINRRDYESERNRHLTKVQADLARIELAQQQWDVLDAAGLSSGPRPVPLPSKGEYPSFEAWLKNSLDPYLVTEITLHGTEES